jgi:hypothetical protein
MKSAFIKNTRGQSRTRINHTERQQRWRFITVAHMRMKDRGSDLAFNPTSRTTNCVVIRSSEENSTARRVTITGSASTQSLLNSIGTYALLGYQRAAKYFI